MPLVSAAVTGFTGQLRVFRFNEALAPFLRCLYPHAPNDGCTGNCAQDGILGAAAGIIGSLQALTALRLLLGEETVAQGSTLAIDLATMRTYTLRWDADPDCPASGGAAQPPGIDVSDSPQEDSLAPTPSSARGAPTLAEDALVIDLREPREVCPIDRVLLPGAQRLPMTALAAQLDSLDSAGSYLLVCEHGGRSGGYCFRPTPRLD